MTATDPKIVFIGGAGNMGGAVIGGLLAAGYPADRIVATGRDPQKLAAFAKRHGVAAHSDTLTAIGDADVIVLSVKPQAMRDLCTGLRSHLDGHNPLIISFAAGIPLAAYQRWLGEHLPIVRAMPNTPALVQTGATGLYAGAGVTAEHRAITERIANAVGIFLWVREECEINQIIAVVGSAPAYFFLFMEAMIEASVASGFARADAERLVLQTALGAAKLAMASEEDVAKLKRNVMSPGGTTECAVKRFEQGGLFQLVAEAMRDCAERASEMERELDR
ncbi:pyrroline-5-carboxylate reductase [Microbulbifer sp. 2205BS26-8]|uniref:pyrroline-5-carboxylate reductase n=1 Tax=Microbulbifer sp. 2205BS26-8 TaxID=3064386 RepID=UPI00273F38A4|nr:pyrroline-5-carboxylate reductase [Microbulbifer sp. 2205BS26-8]MDP5209639.1 pyrroline-5-carboxylate reductase [Microbulbifer sp. 2205BS26-8]